MRMGTQTLKHSVRKLVNFVNTQQTGVVRHVGFVLFIKDKTRAIVNTSVMAQKIKREGKYTLERKHFLLNISG